jgi:hypothetical protein
MESCKRTSLLIKEEKMALLLKAVESSRHIAPANGTNFSLEELQQAVGGYIEIVRVIKTDDYIMVIDEEGKLKNKPVNLAATAFANIGDGDCIVGDVIFCKDSEVQ